MDGGVLSEKFVNRVYDAALEPNGWLGVIRDLAVAVGADTASLAQLDIETGLGPVIGPWLNHAALKDYTAYYAAINPLVIVQDSAEYLHTWLPLVFSDEAWIDRGALLRTEYYNDFLKPLRRDWSMTIRLGLNAKEVSSISLYRSDRKGRFSPEELDLARSVHGHLVRAYHLTTKLTAATSVNAAAAVSLDRSEHGMFVVDDKGRIRHANGAGEALLMKGQLCSIGGRLSATTPDLDRRLTALIACAGSLDSAQRKGGSMTIPTPDRGVPLSITAIPVQPDRLSLFAEGPSVLVCVRDRGVGVSLSEQQAGEMFRLTAAESRVALALVEGLSVQEIAERFGVAAKTVRVQLSSIFVKTGTHRQAELVRLLANTAMFDIA